jgi:hypothetical protein
MATNAPYSSLRLVQLDHIIENLAEEAYKDLQTVVTSLKDQPDEAKCVSVTFSSLNPSPPSLTPRPALQKAHPAAPPGRHQAAPSPAARFGAMVPQVPCRRRVQARAGGVCCARCGVS